MIKINSFPTIKIRKLINNCKKCIRRYHMFLLRYRPNPSTKLLRHKFSEGRRTSRHATDAAKCPILTPYSPRLHFWLQFLEKI